MLSNISGLYPLDTISCDNHKCLWASPNVPRGNFTPIWESLIWILLNTPSYNGLPQKGLLPSSLEQAVE